MCARVPPADRVFGWVMLARIAAGGVSMAACVLCGYAWGLQRSQAVAQSMGFVCWLMGHIMLAINQRTAVQPVCIAKDVTTNKPLLVWVFAVFVLGVLVGTVNGLDTALALVHLRGRDWGVAVAVCVGGTFWIEVVKVCVWLYGRRPPPHPTATSIV